MTIEQFTAARGTRWAELEELVQRGRRGRLRSVPAADLERFGSLYRQAASDLAIARRDFPDDAVAAYLNALVARAHPLLFRGAPVRPAGLARWFAVGIPRSFREHRGYVLLSVAILLAAAIAGWLAVDLRPDLRASLVPASGFDQLARGQVSSLPAAPLLGTVIITNNIKVAVLCFVGGFAAGVPTAFLLAVNGWMLGTLAEAVHAGGYDLAFWSLIVPHGVLELSIIVITGAAGLCIGDALLRPGLRGRGDAVSRAALGTVGLAAGAASLLVVSGLLEAYVSPSLLPAWAKLLVGAVVGVFLYAWLLGAGRRRVAPPALRLDRAAAGRPASPA